MEPEPTRRAILVFAAGLSLAPMGVAAAPLPTRMRAPAFENIAYAEWVDSEPDYRLYPGDQIEVATPSAPELTRSLVVGPDGRISLPLIGTVMAADRTTTDLETLLSRAYATELVRPNVEVTLKQPGPMKVLVGGEVATPGWVEMNGDLDALQAIMAAGGAKATGQLGSTIIIRRSPGGRLMRRTANLARGLRDPAHADLIPLRRFDIVFVPRSSLGEADAFMAKVRDLLPFSLSFAPPIR